MPVKRRFDKHRAELPADAIDWLHDGKGGVWFYFFRGDFGELWREHEEAIVLEHVAEFPGTRPVRWWEYSAPRAQPRDYHCKASYRPDSASPRLRLGGVGTPTFEVLGDAPRFWCGVPLTWVTRRQAEFYGGLRNRSAPFRGVPIDPNDPPMFESEAAYLDRHGLLLTGERPRLKTRDFQPESILKLLDFGESAPEIDR